MGVQTDQQDEDEDDVAAAAAAAAAKSTGRRVASPNVGQSVMGPVGKDLDGRLQRMQNANPEQWNTFQHIMSRIREQELHCQHDCVALECAPLEPVCIMLSGVGAPLKLTPGNIYIELCGLGRWLWQKLSHPLPLRRYSAAVW